MGLTPTDNEIITRVLAGEQAAFALLVERYQQYVFTLVLRYIKSREDAEEVAQDVFVKAYRSLASYRGDAKFSTWIYTIVNSVCLSFLRKKKPVIQEMDEERFQEIAERPGSGRESKELELKSRAAMVNRAIRQLSADDAAVLTLFYQAEQNLEEIAAILGLEANAAKVRLHRARGRLKTLLETNYKEEIGDIYH